MDYDYEILRQRRESIEPNLTKFAKKFKLNKTMVSRIERGIGVRLTNLEKYLSCLDLTLEDIELVVPLQRYSEPSFIPPRLVIFRPYLWPTEMSDAWKNSQTTITFVDWRIHPGELGSRVDGIEFSIVFPKALNMKRVVFEWRSWVAIDGSEITEEENPDNNARWRGEINPFGYGSSVQPHIVNPGQVLSNELMFEPTSKLPWCDFSNTFLSHNIDNAMESSLRFEASITWFQQKGALRRQSIFNVPIKCLNRGFEETSIEGFKLAQFLQLRTIEGGINACHPTCC